VYYDRCTCDECLFQECQMEEEMRFIDLPNYKLDLVESLKADVFDLMTYPVMEEEMEFVDLPSYCNYEDKEMEEELMAGLVPSSSPTTASINGMESSMNMPAHDVNARYQIDQAIFELSCKINKEAEQKYGITKPPVPKTASEIIEAIKSGNITIPDTKNQKEDLYQWDSFRGIAFAKDFKRDQEGYAKYMKGFNEEKKSLKLDVVVLPVEEGLKKFRIFEEKWTQ
jgi:hypothetical protein